MLWSSVAGSQSTLMHLRAKRLLGAVIALPAVAAACAHAAPPRTAADCAAIDDDTARLACYDEATGRTHGASAPNAPPPAPASPTPAASSPAAAAAAVTSTAVRAATGQSSNIAKPPPTPRSLLGEAWALDGNARDPRFNLRFHNPNYVIFRYSDHVNDQPHSPGEGTSQALPAPLQPNELKFQVSFKARLWETENRRLAVWLGYTQQSNWQIFNERLSRPFRETDYEPELMVALRPDIELDGWRWRLLNFGIVHQSNGRADPLSRSWNRVYAQFGVEHGNFAFYVRPWYRLHETADDDNNPDIADYMGHGDVKAIYRSDSGYAITATGRYNARTRKGAAELELSTPPLLGPLKGYLQVFSGYGESLIDYNWRQTTIGVGLTLNDLL
jgi:phospholipase A1